MIIFYSRTVLADQATLEGDEMTHCTRVLRKQTGDLILITDGHGKLYEATIGMITKNALHCHIKKTVRETLHPCSYAICTTPTKNPARLEWFVEKATEIGIREIVLFFAARSEKKNVNEQRLHNILISAMKQSGNLILPKLVICKNTADALEYCKTYQHRFMAYCGEEAPFLSDLTKVGEDTIVLIGPEGDFTSEEVETARKHAFQVVSLGDARLRTETAGIVALMMMHLAR